MFCMTINRVDNLVNDYVSKIGSSFIHVAVATYNRALSMLDIICQYIDMLLCYKKVVRKHAKIVIFRMLQKVGHHEHIGVI